MKFSEIQLHPRLQKNLDELGFTECTKIQEQALPIIRQGKDLAGLAQTGTGKTGAFLIPLIDRLLKTMKPEEGGEAETPTLAFPEWKKKQFILVLVPTRELADQVQENAEKLLAGTDMQSAAVYGGTTYEKQTAALKSGVEFVIATPGRLIDLYKEHVADLGLVRGIVFDEADRMFDMGFKDDMTYILKRVPRERQFMVLSATLNFDVLNVAYEFGSDPIEVNISRDQAKADNVKDTIVHLGHTDKPQYLLSLLKKTEPRQAIIFSNFKHNVEKLTKFLTSNGVPAVGLSSLMTQAQRNRVMEQFKGDNDRNILVATDVAARGLDILGVDLVMNYDLPDDAENYVHRIGRTGRAGQTGNAISLVGDRDVEALQRIEEYLKHKVEVLWLEEADIIQEFKPLPRDEGGYKKPGFGRPDGRGEGRGERGPRRGGGRGGERSAGGRGRGGERAAEERPTDDAAAASAGATAGAERGPRRESHRDRSSGRHRDGQAAAAGGGEGRRESRRHKDSASTTPRAPGASRIVKATPEQRAAAGKGGHGRGKGGHGQRGGHGISKAAQAKQAGLGAKVSGFFKKLFGG